jgi:hypothetical protein
MITGSLVLLLGVGLFAALAGGELLGPALLGFSVSFATVTGKLAFDSLVQRDAPDANYGRSFARFEARFQLAFAVGAFFPVMIRMGVTLGAWLVAIATGAALASYLAGGVGAGGFRRRLPPAVGRVMGGVGMVEPGVASGDVAHDDRGPDEDDDVTTELTAEDIRPSQPAPPAAIDRSLPDWDHDAPYVSSIDGVEVDPTPPPPADAPTDDEGRSG